LKALVKNGEEEGFDLEDIAVPEPGDNDVLVKLHSVAICGSDLKLYKWTPWCKNVVKSLPFIPGHEGAGEVIEVGKDVRGISIGDRVAAETHIACGRCWQCTHGRPHTCQNMELFGHTVNGCFSEYCVIPQVATRKLPADFPLEKGCLLEPMGIPLRAVEAGDVAGETVTVIGCGPIGQFAIGISKIRGAEKIIAVDINKKRLNIAGEMGATHLINPKLKPVSKSILKLTDGNGAGVIIEASGNGNALKEAFHYLRVGGKFFLIGHPPEPVEVDISPQIILKEATVAGFFGREIWKTWDIAEDILSSGQLDTRPMVTHTFPMEEFEKAFELGISGEGCKIVLIP